MRADEIALLPVDPDGSAVLLRERLEALTGRALAVVVSDTMGRAWRVGQIDQAIPPLDRFDWQPKELVAVLGEHRGRHGNAVTCVTYSPDGKTVVSGGANGLVRLWDSATLRQKGPSLGTGSGTLCLAWARDGKWLAAGNAGGAIYLWDVSGTEPKAGPVVFRGDRISASRTVAANRLRRLRGLKIR